MISAIRAERQPWGVEGMLAAMSRRTTTLRKLALSGLHYSGAAAALAPLTRGAGVIFTLHHVRPEQPQAFEPNRILKVTPTFLDAVIRQVLDAGFDVISLDEAHFRLTEGALERPFACFTLDDGYRDNRDHAYPVFRRYGLPFTIYVPSEYASGRGDMWWLALERVICEVEHLQIKMDGVHHQFRCSTADDKDRTFLRIYWWLRGIEEGAARQIVRELCRGIGYDPAPLCADLCMTWDELRELACDPLVTIGGHTRAHYALAKLTHAEARFEMEEGNRILEQELGRPCRHFAYPYGDEGSAGEREFALAKELGLKTAVTTRKGLIHPAHAGHLTALPRVSLNGDYQEIRYVKVLLTGAPFLVWDALSGLRGRGGLA